MRKYEAGRPVKRIFQKADYFGILAIQVIKMGRFKIYNKDRLRGSCKTYMEYLLAQ